MFPNYCFRKRPDDLGYEVLMFPKNNFDLEGKINPSKQSGRHFNTRSRSRFRQSTKYCNDDLLSLKPHSQNTERNEEFLIPHLEKLRQMEITAAQLPNGGMAPADQVLYHKRQDTQPQLHQQDKQQDPLQESQETFSPPASEISSHASNSVRGLQDSCVDFFNIIYENVLEAVHGAIEHMVAKHFQGVLSRINHLTAEMARQENQLKHIKCDLLRKISEHNEANLNQFKFIAQLLIDSQMIHNRGLNNKKKNHPEQRATAGSESLQQAPGHYAQGHASNTPQTQQHTLVQPKPQHQLWQQQERGPHQFPICKRCNQNPIGILKSNRPMVRSLPKSVCTSSLPDLHRATSSTSHR
ncbi:hypothetical protein KR222_003257, partial [Zaprionus bogoriensis]